MYQIQLAVKHGIDDKEIFKKLSSHKNLYPRDIARNSQFYWNHDNMLRNPNIDWNYFVDYWRYTDIAENSRNIKRMYKNTILTGCLRYLNKNKYISIHDINDMIDLNYKNLIWRELTGRKDVTKEIIMKYNVPWDKNIIATKEYLEGNTNFYSHREKINIDFVIDDNRFNKKILDDILYFGTLDFRKISRKIHVDVILKNIFDSKYKWDWKGIWENPSLEIRHIHLLYDRFFDVCNIPFYWSKISENPGIKVKEIINNPNFNDGSPIPWDWEFVSSNPTLTIDLAIRMRDKLSWERVSANPNITYRDVINNMKLPDNSEVPWCAKSMRDNKTIRDEVLDILLKEKNTQFEYNDNITCHNLFTDIGTWGKKYISMHHMVTWEIIGSIPDINYNGITYQNAYIESLISVSSVLLMSNENYDDFEHLLRIYDMKFWHYPYEADHQKVIINMLDRISELEIGEHYIHKGNDANHTALRSAKINMEKIKNIHKKQKNADFWYHISQNPNVNEQILRDNIFDDDKTPMPWHWKNIIKYADISLNFIRELRDGNIISEKLNINWDDVAEKKSVPIEEIIKSEESGEIKWNWDHVSLNPNLTLKIIDEYPQYPWNIKNIIANEGYLGYDIDVKNELEIIIIPDLANLICSFLFI